MKNKRILITGGTGLLGTALIEANNSAYEIMATYFGDYTIQDTNQVKYNKLNILDNEGLIQSFSNFKPEVVIHTASVGSPDFAERNKEYTWEIDVIGTQNIVYNCKRNDSKLIYISSNAIYDGENAPYGEGDEANPINYYGKVKLEGENITKNGKITYAIVRPILMYGWNNPFERSNIITFALQKFKKLEVVNAYEDVFCNSILAQFCAEAIWQMIQNETYDIFNIGGKDVVSIYKLLKIASEVFGFDQNLIRPVQQGFFEGLVRRPRDTSYKTEKMERVLGLRPISVKEGLEIMKANKSRNYV